MQSNTTQVVRQERKSMATKYTEKDGEAMVQSQAKMMKRIHSCLEAMVIKCAVDLRIADIINSHGQPMSLSQIASEIYSASAVDVDGLGRIMRYLVHRRIFDKISDQCETLYCLNYSSRWLLRDADLSLAPLLLVVTNPESVSSLHHLSQSIKNVGSGTSFCKANGHEFWEYASRNPEFNAMFNEGMVSNSKIISQAMLSKYEDGFRGIDSLVDVGGGTGDAIVEIMKAHPHVKGINFDFPHVIAIAPAYPGLSHVGGDMFKGIPCADALLLKFVMHDWNDENCIKILKICRKSVPQEYGKIIIVDVVLEEGGNGLFDDMGLIYDVSMLAVTPGGKERTELEWNKLLEQGGFPRYNIIKIPALPSIIEAFPK